MKHRHTFLIRTAILTVLLSFLWISILPAVEATAGSGVEATQYVDLSGVENRTHQGKDIEYLFNKAWQHGSVRVIVGLQIDFEAEGNLAPELAEAQRMNIQVLQARLLSRLLAAPQVQTARLLRSYVSIPYMLLEVDAAGLHVLLSDPDVSSLQPDTLSRTTLAESMFHIGAAAAWEQGYGGAGQTVAILDTGVDQNHPLLKGKVVSEACYSSNYAPHGATTLCADGLESSVAPGAAWPAAGVCPGDDCEHGAHAAAIAAGSGSSFSGVAPDADLIVIQVFSRFDDSDACESDGPPCIRSYLSDQLAGLERVYELRLSHTLAAVNLSLGSGRYAAPCDTDPRKTIIDNLRSVKIAAIISAGSDGYPDALSAPACISSAVSVGSVDNGFLGATPDAVSDFSNSAPMLDLLAPGRWIHIPASDGSFPARAGTSLAAPHVTGAWAVLKSVWPSAAVDDILMALIATGKPVSDSANGLTRPRLNLDWTSAQVQAWRDLLGVDGGAGPARNQIGSAQLRAAESVEITATSASASALPPHLARLIETAQEQGYVRVIVGLRADFEPEGALPPGLVRAQRQNTQAVRERVLNRLQSRPGIQRAQALRVFTTVPYLAMELDAAALQALQNDPEVRTLHADTLARPTLAESLPLIGADTAWNQGYDGTGQVVAILDTGVDKTHPFLANKVVSEACYSSNSHVTSTICPGNLESSTDAGAAMPYAGNCPAEKCDHGTHVAGIAAGAGSSFSGAAKGANIIAIQVFSRSDSEAVCGKDEDEAPLAPCVISWESDQIAGLERVYHLRNEHAIAAANMSLGGGKYDSPCDDRPAKAIIDNLRSAGIATVISSGNNGWVDAMGAPACISTAISVGSVDDGSGGTTADEVSSFSNAAWFLDLLAPGRWIYGPVPGNVYANWAGTSMAAPHVAGAWAVLKQKKPSATVDEIESALKNTGELIEDVNVTAPRIQVDQALGEISASEPVNIENGDVLTDLNGADGSTLFFVINIPAYATDLYIQTDGGSGNVNLYVRHAQVPSLAEYDCRSNNASNNEECRFFFPAAGNYNIMLYGLSTYTNVTLTAGFMAPAVCQQDFIEVVGSLNTSQEIIACRTVSTSRSGVTITPQTAVRFRAGERISLDSGFRVDKGGIFRAVVDLNM